MAGQKTKKPSQETNKPLQWVRYFNGQFLEADDFTTEQDYHIAMLKEHNMELHGGWGIVNGFNVKGSGQKTVTISSGIAIDRNGNQIILTSQKEYKLKSTSDVYLTLSYNKVSTSKSSTACYNEDTRYEQDIEITESQTKPQETTKPIILAQVKFNAGKISEVDTSEKTTYYFKIENATIENLTVKKTLNDDGNLTVKGPLTAEGTLVGAASSPDGKTNYKILAGRTGTSWQSSSNPTAHLYTTIDTTINTTQANFETAPFFSVTLGQESGADLKNLKNVTVFNATSKNCEVHYWEDMSPADANNKYKLYIDWVAIGEQPPPEK